MTLKVVNVCFSVPNKLARAMTSEDAVFAATNSDMDECKGSTPFLHVEIQE